MTRVALLRFDAPLIAFGAPMVDQNGVVQAFPGRSLLTGLFANALGWFHAEHDEHQALQSRIRFAARIDRRGEAYVDYQTVDLGQPWMDPEQAGWTTRGQIARRGGASSDGTHIRYRHYRADSLSTVAVELVPPEESPSIDDVASALRLPARPLFIGRKACLPSVPILVEVVEAPSALHALAMAPRVAPSARGDGGHLLAWWDASFGEETPGVVGPFEPFVTTDERDWKNQVHTGRRFLTHGRVDPPTLSRNEVSHV